MKQCLRFTAVLVWLAGAILFFACEQPAETTKTSGETINVPLTSIEVRELPDITFYALKQSFDPRGLVVHGVLNDETERDLTASEYVIERVDTTQAGRKHVVVRAGTTKAEFEIYVATSDKVLQSVTLEGKPIKTAYDLGDGFSPAGISVMGTYTDGSTAKVSNAGVTIVGYDKNKRGSQTVSFRVNQYKDIGSFEVTVKIPKEAKITVNKYKSVYVKGEAFDSEWADIEAKATINGADYTLSWGNGGIIKKDTVKNYTSSTLGSQSLQLVLDDATSNSFDIYVADETTKVYFDYGYMRFKDDANGAGEGAGKYYVKPNETLVLAPVRFLLGYGKDHHDTGASYSWSVSGGSYTAPSTSGEFFSFTPTEAKPYTVTVSVTGNDYVTNQSATKTASTEVVCYNSPVSANGKTFPSYKPTASPHDSNPAPQNTLKNFAPGQFTEQGNGYGWSLGAQGGYQIWSVQHRADYLITGNPMAGWEEPGVVWVMEDNNGSGLPDEMWYELKGSEDSHATRKNQIVRRYGLTYFNVDTGGSGRKDRRIFWVDSKGRGGMMPGGWPTNWGVKSGNWVTYTGTLLRDTGYFDTTKYPSSYFAPLEGFSGYVDVVGDRTRFKISNAMRADGTPITLTNVKFIKVQTGLFRYGGSMGEISTEIYEATDLGTGGPQTTFPLP